MTSSSGSYFARPLKVNENVHLVSHLHVHDANVVHCATAEILDRGKNESEQYLGGTAPTQPSDSCVRSGPARLKTYTYIAQREIIGFSYKHFCA